MIKKNKLFVNLLIFIEKKFIYFEKKFHFPNILYKLLTVNAYLIGYIMSKNKKNAKIFFGWYK